MSASELVALADLADLIERLTVEADGWKQVAVELNAYIADNVLDPNACAVHAYNHARNGRWVEARSWLAAARA